ncbi:hypothetical protein [Mangrovibacterium sp.]|uniref:hypothetical protein n=1 Tax=Mangrovibacterium sp. TaxID=1961364 RepID=UPI003567060A
MNQRDLKQLWYLNYHNPISIKEKLRIQMWRIVELLLFKPSPHLFSGWRVFILKCFGAKIGKGCFISPKAEIFMPWNLELGNFSAIDNYVYIKNKVKITIEDYVSIATHTQIIPGGHDVKSRQFASDLAPVRIRNGAFIGSSTFIGKGVTIGQMCVIGARSVVLKDMPENYICFGHPCKPIAPRLEKETYENFRYNYL